jgi:hypothetical protein
MFTDSRYGGWRNLLEYFTKPENLTRPDIPLAVRAGPIGMRSTRIFVKPDSRRILAPASNAGGSSQDGIASRLHTDIHITEHNYFPASINVSET